MRCLRRGVAGSCSGATSVRMVHTMVLDEADEMLKMGHADAEKINRRESNRRLFHRDDQS
ncbi:MAG: hypothetical protein ACLUI3_03685 [Christensenellales bacterium]